MEKSQKEESDNMAARRRIWKQALGMCNDDRDAFVAELKATQKTIKGMSKQIEFSTKMNKFTIDKELVKYTDDIKAADMGEISASDKSTNADNLTQFTRDVIDGLAEAKKNFDAATALKTSLIG